MLVTYFPDQVSLAGRDVMAKFMDTVRRTDTVTANNHAADIAVIWSVLWQGRMQANQKIYNYFRSQNKPVIILETGNLIRGQTFKVCLNNINRQGTHAGQFIAEDRTDKFKNIFIETKSGENIIICCQQTNSLLWDQQPRIEQWLDQILRTIRQQTSRPIEIRPHPRQQSVDFGRVMSPYKRISAVQPIRNFKLDTTDFVSVLNRAHCVIGHNAGGLIESAVRHVPIIAHNSSLCFDISNQLQMIEDAKNLTTKDWLKFISSTEWFVDEIAAGVPWQALRSNVLHEVD